MKTIVDGQGINTVHGDQGLTVHGRTELFGEVFVNGTPFGDAKVFKPLERTKEELSPIATVAQLNEQKKELGEVRESLEVLKDVVAKMQVTLLELGVALKELVESKVVAKDTTVAETSPTVVPEESSVTKAKKPAKA